MTTLFFSPFASDVDDPALLGPGVEDDDDGKPDMWHTRGRYEGCYRWGNVGSVGERGVAKKRRETKKKANTKE